MAFISKLNNKYPWVTEHCHFAQGLNFARMAFRETANFGYAIHNLSHLFAERTGKFFADFIEACANILNCVMEQPGNRPGFVSNQLVEKCANPGAVSLEIWLTAQTLLAGVKLLAP